MNTQELQTALDHAGSYSEWKKFASELDQAEGKDAWRSETESDLYDWSLLRSRTKILRKLRKKQDYDRLIFRLREELHGNLGNMANPDLYRQARSGTKNLINKYLDEVCASLTLLCDTDVESLPAVRKKTFFKRTARSFGRSALLLSGGASLGLFHLGVIEELIEQVLLPRVVTGSSSGSIIGGVLATNGPETLQMFVNPDYHDYQWNKLLGLGEAVRGKGLMDQDNLRSFINLHIPEMTFLEAYQETGYILNITVSPADSNQFPRLLNYLTAPNVLIRSAALASSAVPGLFAPVQLRARNFEGKSVSYMPQSRWIDGSVHEDIPTDKVNRLHNVNHYIVSQTNPHVVPFLTEEISETGLLPYLQDLVIKTPLVQLEHFLETTQRNFDIPGLSTVIKKTHAVVSQNYSGDITIFPHHSHTSVSKALSRATPERADQLIMEGRRASWPQIERIRNTTQISRTLDKCISQLDGKVPYLATA